MTTLNQILIEKLEDSRSIDLWKMIAKEWLQQKQIPVKINMLFQDEEIRQQFLKELLEDLE